MHKELKTEITLLVHNSEAKMTGKILILSLDNVNVIKSEEFKKRDIESQYILELGDFESAIKKFNPDAVLIQANEISDVIIYRMRESFKRYGVRLPWLALVLKNSSFSEKVARSNRVFYYGVGIEDVGFVADASKDAIIIGKQYKLEDRFIKQSFGIK